MISHIAYDVFTEKTIRSEEELSAELGRVKAQGYAVDDGEVSEHIKCVAVPVFDENGSCQYSLGASGAASRMTQEKIDRIIPLLVRTASGIFA